mmetsp:Transcript_75634/g.133643  ORF Transcript_75634/g.133643 Transcript_75634/m.133643 type:complete len:102 (+) Transcript_75634:1924-2229(+)
MCLLGLHAVLGKGVRGGAVRVRMHGSSFRGRFFRVNPGTHINNNHSGHVVAKGGDFAQSKIGGLGVGRHPTHLPSMLSPSFLVMFASHFQFQAYWFQVQTR